VASSKDFETGFVLSQIRYPGEDIKDATSRVFSSVAVPPEAIENPNLRQLRELQVQLLRSGTAMHPILASEVLGVDKKWLLDRMARVDPASHAVYGRMVMEQYEARLSGKAKSDLRSILDREDLGLEEAMAEMAKAVSEARSARYERNTRSLADSVAIWRMKWDAIQEKMASGEPRFSFGGNLSGLDDLVPMVLPGNMILITGGTGVGKSTLSIQIYMDNLARGLRCAYARFEDDDVTFTTRLIAQEMAYEKDAYGRQIGISADSMLRDVITNSDKLELISTVQEKLSARDGHDLYCLDWTMGEALSALTNLNLKLRMQDNRGLDVVFLDYLNKTRIPDSLLRSGGVFWARGQDAQQAKTFAEENECVVVLLQQENDDGSPYETTNSRRQSQVALSVKREWLDNGSLDTNGDVVVTKANMGRTGSVNVRFYPSFMTWVER
jgi:replicative DNA helicase